MPDFVKVAVALVLAAAGSGMHDYRAWEKQPVAWFMTESEAADWRVIETVAAAAAFIAEYRARRVPEFETMVVERVLAADRHFSRKGVPGSHTLRGRIVILLGAPAQLVRENATTTGVIDDPGAGMIYTNVGPLGGGSVSYRLRPTLYTFVYTVRPLTVTVAVDERSGEETIASRSERERLRKRFQEAAAESIQRNRIKN